MPRALIRFQPARSKSALPKETSWKKQERTSTKTKKNKQYNMAKDTLQGYLIKEKKRIV